MPFCAKTKSCVVFCCFAIYPFDHLACLPSSYLFTVASARFDLLLNVVLPLRIHRGDFDLMLPLSRCSAARFGYPYLHHPKTLFRFASCTGQPAVHVTVGTYHYVRLLAAVGQYLLNISCFWVMLEAGARMHRQAEKQVAVVG